MYQPLRQFSILAFLTVALCFWGERKNADPLPTSTPDTAGSTTNAPPGYTLVWSDEFRTDGLPDATLWR